MSPPSTQRNIKSPLHSSFKHHRSTYSTARLRDEEFAALSVRPRASSDAGISDSRSRSKSRRRSLRFASLAGDEEEEEEEEEEEDTQSKYDWASICDMLYSKLRTTDLGRLSMRSRRKSECSIPTEKLHQRRLSSPSVRSRDYSGSRNEDNQKNRAYNTFRLKETEFAITPTRSSSERRRPLLGKTEVQHSSIKETEVTSDQKYSDTPTKSNKSQRHRSSSQTSDATSIKEIDQKPALPSSVGVLRSECVARPRSGSDPRITPITINRPDFSRRSLKQKPTYVNEPTITPNFLNPNPNVNSLRSRSYTNLQERSSEFQSNGQSRRPRSVSPIDMGLLGGTYIDPSIIEKFLMNDDTEPEVKTSKPVSVTVPPPDYVESQNDLTTTHEDPPPAYDEACLSFKI